ncbi:MAG: ABC transporter permease [Acidobacteria bacterium]|nr:ABC transporter permease [Acidobacteriota bacterium]
MRNGDLRSELHPSDLARTATIGARTRPLRAALSALGIMIGIGAMVAVLGLSESSKSELLAQLERLGTNLLTVQAGAGIGRGDAVLPDESIDMVGRIGPVESTAYVINVDANVYRTDLIPEAQTGGIAVMATEPNLLDAVNGTVAVGVFLNDASAGLPAVVLGSVTAQRLGIESLAASPMIWLGEEWFVVVGILESLDLHPNLDRSALIGVGIAESLLDSEDPPTTIYVRAQPEDVVAVANVLPATVNPEFPDQVNVTRPTDTLEVQEAADDTLTALFLGLGAVALLVGGVGIANVMVISVLERRSEIGLRRALGATRKHITYQFLSESILLAGTGGVAGVLLGAGVTAAWASYQGWDTLVPLVAVVGGLVAAVAIGAIAGLYPALRAAKLSPTEALRT